MPKDDYGLQVMFTKYTEVRRPTETPFVHGGAPAIKHDETTFPVPHPDKGGPSSDPHPLPTARNAKTSDRAKRTPSANTVQTDAASGGETNLTVKVVDPTDSRGTPERPVVITKLAQSEKEIEANGLPTVVSHKAHKPIRVSDVTRAKEAFAELKRMERERYAGITAATPSSFMREIKFPAGSPKTIWTGRNGTFNSLGVELQREAGTDVCSIVPQGKRGTAKNAIIEFPVAAIPQMIDFLQSQLH